MQSTVPHLLLFITPLPWSIRMESLNLNTSIRGRVLNVFILSILTRTTSSLEVVIERLIGSFIMKRVGQLQIIQIISNFHTSKRFSLFLSFHNRCTKRNILMHRISYIRYRQFLDMIEHKEMCDAIKLFAIMYLNQTFEKIGNGK